MTLGLREAPLGGVADGHSRRGGGGACGNFLYQLNVTVCGDNQRAAIQNRVHTPTAAKQYRIHTLPLAIQWGYTLTGLKSLTVS